jgi:hypothetical protein
LNRAVGSLFIHSGSGFSRMALSPFGANFDDSQLVIIQEYMSNSTISFFYFGAICAIFHWEWTGLALSTNAVIRARGFATSGCLRKPSRNSRTGMSRHWALTRETGMLHRNRDDAAAHSGPGTAHRRAPAGHVLAALWGGAAGFADQRVPDGDALESNDV